MEKAFEQQPSTCLKVVLFGPESTGKTTLARQLAAHFKCPWVPEFMREYLQKKWTEHGEKITRDDLLPIAAGQVKQENAVSQPTTTLMFCDTNLLQLKVYSEYYYNGFCPKEILESISNSHYDLYLLTNIDTPWVADDLRDRPDDRFTLFRIFEAELKNRQLPFAEICGSETQRLQQAIALTEKLRRR